MIITLTVQVRYLIYNQSLRGIRGTIYYSIVVMNIIITQSMFPKHNFI